MLAVTNWKNGATPTRFVWQYLCCQRQNKRLQAPTKACGDLLRRPNQLPTSLNFNWLNGVSAAIKQENWKFYGNSTRNYDTKKWRRRSPIITWLCNFTGTRIRRFFSEKIHSKRLNLSWLSILTLSVKTGWIVWSMLSRIVFKWIITETHFFSLILRSNCSARWNEKNCEFLTFDNGTMPAPPIQFSETFHTIAVPDTPHDLSIKTSSTTSFKFYGYVHPP